MRVYTTHNNPRQLGFTAKAFCIWTRVALNSTSYAPPAIVASNNTGTDIFASAAAGVPVVLLTKLVRVRDFSLARALSIAWRVRPRLTEDEVELVG